MVMFTSETGQSAGQLAVLVARDFASVSDQTLEDYAREHGVGLTYMSMARNLVRDAPELAEAVLAGEFGLSIAHDLYRRRREITVTDRTKAGMELRDATIRRMADEGYSESDIADAVGIGPDRLRWYMHNRLHIKTLRDKLGVNSRLNADRVMDSLVTAAQPSLDAIDALDWDALDPSRLEGWERGLSEAIRQWTSLRNRLKRRKG